MGRSEVHRGSAFATQLKIPNPGPLVDTSLAKYPFLHRANVNRLAHWDYSLMGRAAWTCLGVDMSY